jgi:hypothetical protein
MKKLIILFLFPLIVKAQMPTSSTLLYNFNMADANALTSINGADTTLFYAENTTPYGEFYDAASVNWYVGRNAGFGEQIKSGALWSTIKDGTPVGSGYPRSEMTLSQYSFTIDTSHTYTLEWKGYFPQNYNYLTSWYQILVAMQIHSLTQVATVWGIDLDTSSNLISGDVHDVGGGTLVTANTTIGTLSGWYNIPHTVRVTLREGKGYTGQTAFFHLQVDGVTKYRRDTGQVGHFDDYVKFGGLYDWNSAMVNVDSTTRGRRFSLVTQSYKVYQDVSDIADAPTVSMSGNQAISTSSTSIYSTAIWAAGHSGTYAWTKTSGPAATITSSTSASTTVTGLTTGIYVFRNTLTQDDGQTVYGEVTVNVSSPPFSNVRIIHNNIIFQ